MRLNPQPLICSVKEEKEKFEAIDEKEKFGAIDPGGGPVRAIATIESYLLDEQTKNNVHGENTME